MLAGTKKISAANENAAVRPRLSTGCVAMTRPQRQHSAAAPRGSVSIRCSRPQVLQALMDSTGSKLQRLDTQRIIAGRLVKIYRNRNGTSPAYAAARWLRKMEMR